jgi:hypothetical protein
MVRTSTRSGGVRKPSPVSLLVSLAIANVKKRFKAEHAAAKRAEKAAKQAESEHQRHARENAGRAKLRRKDAEVVEKLLEMGQCCVRFKLRGARQMVRCDGVDRAKWLNRHESIKHTTWAFCKACDDEGRHAWHTPFRLYEPDELDAGCRHVPGCVHTGVRCPTVDELRNRPTLRDVRVLPRDSYCALDVPLAPPSPPPPPETPERPEQPPPPRPTFPKCQRNLTDKPPTPDYVLTASNVVCSDSERNYNLETPLKRALRQRAHSHKDVRGMNDVVFYKHMRDHNLEPEEAHAEVLARKRLIHAGRGSTYEAPDMGHLVFGLLDGEPIPDHLLPPEAVGDGPWQAYLNERPLDKAGLVQALEAF